MHAYMYDALEIIIMINIVFLTIVADTIISEYIRIICLPIGPSILGVNCLMAYPL